MIWEQFQWNKPLDEALFSTDPPPGYTEQKAQAVTVADQVQEIVNALQVYSDLSEGFYPQVKVIYGDVIRDDMFKLAGIDPLKVRNPKDKNYVRISESMNGFARMTVIMRENPDASYHGTSVGPHDKDKILFRWKLEDESYQNIYGDLHSAKTNE